VRPWIATTAGVLGALIAFMAFAAWREWPWWEYAFLSDGSPVAWLSGALLAANAAVVLSLRAGGRFPARLAYPLASALVYLALDEQFQLHERFKDRFGHNLAGNLPILLVGVVGGVFGNALFKIVPREAGRLLAVAVGLGIFAIWIDLAAPGPLALLEEGFEVLAEAMFLCGLLEAARDQVQSLS